MPMLAGVICLTAAGCAPSIQLPPPDISLPNTFEAPANAPAAEAVALDAWWLDFADPQLTTLIDLALERSTTARLAFARIAEARATRDQSRASTLPTGSLTGNATTQGSEPLWGGGASQGASASYLANFAPSWEIDLFGRLAATRTRADIDYRSAALDFHGARLALVADVAGGLFQARYLAVQLANANETLSISRELAATGELGFARGLTAGQDAARLRADLASAEAEVVRIEAELRAAKRLLLILVGDPMASTDGLAIAAALAPPPGVPGATPGLLLARRPDVRAAELDVQAAAQTLTIDRLALFPRFTINPGVGLTAAAGAGTGLWSIAAGLAMPVLDRARLLAALRVSEARGQQAVVGYERAVQTAFGEAGNALTRVDAGRRRLGQLTRAADQARYAFEAARRGYAAGLTDLTTLLQSQRTWLQNRSTLNAAQFNLLSDTVAAIRALGGGWNPQTDLGPRADMPSTSEAR